MDSQNDSAKLDQIYRLLALCARAEGHPVFYRELKKQIRAFTAWDELPTHAEIQGMPTLFWHHVQQAHIKIPTETQLIFKGLYLRTRVYNQILTRALLEMIPILNKAGIQPLLLKGLALAHQYYPNPALRPVSDIDLYFEKKDFLRAAQLFQEAGYKVKPPAAPKKYIPKSLTADRLSNEGINIHVELHHYDPRGGHKKGNIADTEFAHLHGKPAKIKIEGATIPVPNVLDTLLFLSRHLTKHIFTGNEKHPAQLKWFADIVSLVERHADTLDWEFLKKRHPDLINRLELFYSLTPIPKHIVKALPIRPTVVPDALGQYPPGWPHQNIREWKQTGYFKFLFRMFFPPAEWWTRFYYGISKENIFWHRHVIYRRDVWRAAFWTLLHRLRTGI
jgi:hypothetical protein